MQAWHDDNSIEVVKKWLIQFSRFHTQYENDKMGLCCLQRKIHKTELLLLAQICTKSLSAGASPQTTTGGSLQYCPDPLAGLRGGAAGERVTREGRGKRRDRKGGEGLDERGSWTPRDFQMD